MMLLVATVAFLVRQASAECKDLPTNIVDCGKYVGNGRECINQGSGCTGAGWFSKDNTSNPNQRINAQQVCKDQGYTGMDANLFGGNWGHQCRYPGNSVNTMNKAGGQATALGYTVGWKCAGTKNCGNVKDDDKKDEGKCPDLPSPVVDCVEYAKKGNSRECIGKGAGCATTGWFSKDNTSNPNQRINAQQVCIQQGYKDGMDTTHFGGNWGHQCRYPGNTANSPNKAGGQATALGYTVSWKCAGTQSCGTPVTKKPTGKPTAKPVTPRPTVLPTRKPVVPAKKCADYDSPDACSDDPVCKATVKKGKLKKCKRNPSCKKAHKNNIDKLDGASCEADINCKLKKKTKKGEIKKMSCKDAK